MAALADDNEGQPKERLEFCGALTEDRWWLRPKRVNS